jgi:hypothetical protein
MILTTLTQDPVKARFRGDIHTLICQARDDLAWREARKSLTVAGRRDQVTFLCAGLVGRGWTFRDRPQVFPDRAIRGAPALQCAWIKTQCCAGSCLTRTRGHGLVNEGNNFMAI